MTAARRDVSRLLNPLASEAGQISGTGFGQAVTSKATPGAERVGGNAAISATMGDNSMSSPISMRLSDAAHSVLKRKSENEGVSMSDAARQHIEYVPTHEELAETYLLALYGMRADTWFIGRVEYDAQVATGAIVQTRQLHISPELKKAIVKRLAHYLPPAVRRMSQEMRDGETPGWNHGGGAKKTSMDALRASYVIIYDETGDVNPGKFEAFVEALEDGDINHAFSLK